MNSAYRMKMQVTRENGIKEQNTILGIFIKEWGRDPSVVSASRIMLDGRKLCFTAKSVLQFGETCQEVHTRITHKIKKVVPNCTVETQWEELPYIIFRD